MLKQEKLDLGATIGTQLKSVKNNLFVGRQAEYSLFAEALANRENSWKIMNVHGPGGIGKSTFLDACRRGAEDEGAFYLYFDARDLGSSPQSLITKINDALPDTLPYTDPGPEGCLNALRHISITRALVVVFDTFEDIGELNRWLRESFLPKLPQSSLVVIAGRYALDDQWYEHHTWCRLIKSISLSGFNQEESEKYLRLHDIEDIKLANQIWRHTGGHPLALSLATMIVKRDGPTAIMEIPEHPEIIDKLTQRWLRELPDETLKPMIEAAAIVRCFDQDLLEHITQTSFKKGEFAALTHISFIRRGLCGWSLHKLIRDALAHNLEARSPNAFRAQKSRALHYFAKLATTPGNQKKRTMFLQEFFYLLGDGLVRAALYCEQPSSEGGHYVETATPADYEELDAYMEEWRQHRGVLGGIKVELYDRDNQLMIPQWVASEPREPEFLNLREIIDKMPGSIRMARDPKHKLRGITIVTPINRNTYGYLAEQPVMNGYFQALSAEEKAEYITDPAQTNNWFIRLIDTRDQADQETRAALSLDMLSLLIRPARFVTSTPLPFYQDMLARFGFLPQEHPEPHFDFGRDRPAPYFILDLRGARLPAYLQHMILEYTGKENASPFDPDLVEAVATQISVTSGNDDALFEMLTKRERQVALAAVEGLPNCSIAEQLNVTEITVKKHMSRVFDKLGIRNRAELIKQYWLTKGG